jgi:gp54 protein
MTIQPAPNLTTFTYSSGVELRTATDEQGETIVCLADLAHGLGIKNTSQLKSRLPKGVCRTYTLQTAGGPQSMLFVTEAGMNMVIWRSDKPEAIAYAQWCAERIAELRRTGTYVTRPRPGLSEDEIIHQALQITARRVEQLEADLAKALPKANTWDALCSGRGDHSITDAAKLLSSAGIATGPRKLHKQLQDLGWIHKNQRDKWAANQDKLNTGLLAEKVRHYIDDDGVSVLATPQVRVTPKGLEKLRELLTPADLQEVLA